MKIKELNLNMCNILEKIEEVRKEKGIKQSALADLLGVTQSAYSQYVRRNQDIKFGKIELIANKLGVSVVDIVTYPDKWVQEKDVECEKCKQKDAIIQSLTEYIEILKRQLKTK